MPAVSRLRRGFTLVELSVTLLVVGVLATVAALTAVHVFTGAQDSGARSLLRGVAAAEQLRYRSRGVFVADPAGMAQLSSTAQYVDGASAAGPGVVSAAAGQVGGVDAVALATTSGSGTCFTLVTFAPDAGRPDLAATLITGSACTGAAALAAAG